MPSNFVVERERRITGSPADILERIVDFRRWRSWSPWEDTDPNLHRTYSGAEAGVGAIYEWDGNRKAGKGRMAITAVVPNRSLTIDLQFLEPFRSHSTVDFTLQPDGTATVVRWSMTGPRTLMIRFMGIFMSMDKMIGRDFEKGLARLEADVEQT